MQVGYRQKSRFWSNSWLSKIAGRAKCQKHLPSVLKIYRHEALRGLFATAELLVLVLAEVCAL